MNALLLHRSIEQLPPPFQEKVADYVAFLQYEVKKTKAKTNEANKLADFIGSIPELDVASFENYLTETRKWNESF